jgi:hypothetical protein
MGREEKREREASMGKRRRKRDEVVRRTRS